jgi:hypothetical protein
LQKRFQATTEEFSAIGEELILCINEFEELLKSIHLLPPTPDYDIERTIATLSLLNYLAQAQSSSYNSYALQVLLLALKDNQLAEAAAVLLKMAESLSWSEEEILPPMDVVWGSHTPFEEEPARTRKLRMYADAVDLLDKDCQYEKAIEILLDQVDNGCDDKAIKDRIVALKTKMETEDRLVCEFFRVGFYGKGFGSLNNVSCVFRGSLLERLDEFNSRMQAQFPNAVLLSYTHEPPEEVLEEEGQNLQIFRVFPSSEDEMDGLDEEVDFSIPASMRRYRRYNDCCVFLYDKPVKKTKTGSEVADMWVEQSYFVTEMTLPNIARFSVVLDEVVRELSPLELAIKTMKDKNNDLIDVVNLYSSETPPSDAQPFISLVQGVVDAAVGGGFGVYEDIFFSDKYGEWDQELAGQITVYIDNQVELMGEALELWPKVCPATFQPLLDHLEKQFKVLKKK